MKFNTTIRSAKRTAKERVGVHAWHPYYAGYSEQFVESSLEHLDLRKGIVLDPWAGSGTTNLVCGRAGVDSIGFDVNPVMCHFAAAKQGVVLDLLDTEEIKKYLEASELSIYSGEVSTKLQELLSVSLARQLLGLLHTIQRIDIPTPTLSKELRPLARNVSITNPLRSFLIACFFVTARNLASYQRGSNPTWFKRSTVKPTYRKTTIVRSFIDTMFKMASDLRETYSVTPKQSISLSCVGDSKDLSLPDDIVDAVITSPPYLTRIDYAVSTQLELLLLSGSSDFRTIREATMGAPVIKKQVIEINKNWGNKAVGLLKQVAKHYSKASKSYYLKNKKQYFSDAYNSLHEINRVLKPGGTALIVVQSSYYKEVEIPLGEIYREMGAAMGFKADIAFREAVKGHMAHVNTKSSEYKKDKVYFEDVVELKKKGSGRKVPMEDEIVAA